MGRVSLRAQVNGTIQVANLQQNMPKLVMRNDLGLRKAIGNSPAPPGSFLLRRSFQWPTERQNDRAGLLDGARQSTEVRTIRMVPRHS